MSERQEEQPFVGIAGKITEASIRPDGVREITDIQLDSVSLASVAPGGPTSFQWKSNEPSYAIAWTVAWIKCLHLDKVTFDTIQAALERIYRDDRSNPSHLFIAEQDQAGFEYSVMHYAANEGPALAQILNYITGRMLHLVILPGLPDGSIALGFFEQLQG